MVLKSDVEMDKEQDRQLVRRMDSVKTSTDQLTEEVETVRKMKGPKGEQGDMQRIERRQRISRTTRREAFEGRDGRTGPFRSVSSSPLHFSECVLLRLRLSKQIPVDRKDE